MIQDILRGKIERKLFGSKEKSVSDTCIQMLVTKMLNSHHELLMNVIIILIIDYNKIIICHATNHLLGWSSH